MPNKRKRHQNAEETVILDEKSLPLPENDSLENEDTLTTSPIVMTPEIEVNVNKKIFHAVKEMSRALKKARDFEARKIIKRIKAAKETNDSQKVSRLQKELQIAKSLDVHPFAEIHVYKSLLSDNLFVEHPQLLHPSPKVESFGENEGITKNIVGRLNSASTVKTAMSNAINAIHRAAGMELPYLDRSFPTTRQQKSPVKNLGLPVLEMTPVSTTTSRQATHSPGFIRSDAPVPESDIASDEEASDLELSTIKSQSQSPPLPKRTTFLPSLSTGYIPASDSSDPDEEYNSFAPLKKLRKNKRGQRERQAIWLKKYGSNARHLHPELKNTNPPKAKNMREEKGQDGLQTIEPPAAPEVVKKVNDPHPSWTAKQKLRDQQKAIIGSVKPQKIVFD